MAPAHAIDVPVRFRDLDALGHLNSSVYLTYMETARVDWFHSLEPAQAWYRVPFILASARCEYLRPVHGPGAVRVEVWVSRIGASSWDLDYRVVEGDEVAAVGRTVQVAYDYNEGRTTKITDALRALLERHQGEPVGLRT